MGRQSFAPRPRLPALPASGVRSGADAAGAFPRSHSGHLRDARPDRQVARRARSPRGRRGAAHPRALRAGGSVDPRVHRLAHAGRGADHPSHQPGLVTDRVPARRPRATDSQRAVRVELGSSVEQGAHPRLAGSDLRVERRSAAGSAQPPRRARRSHRRHRRAVFRSVVQPSTLARPGDVLRARRAARRPAVRDVRVLDALRAQPAGSEARGGVDPARARQPPPASPEHRDPRYGRIRRGSSSGRTST